MRNNSDTEVTLPLYLILSRKKMSGVKHFRLKKSSLTNCMKWSHCAEDYSKLRQSRNSLLLKEPQSSLLCYEAPTGLYPEPEQSSTHLISLRSILTLSSHLCLGLSSGPFPSSFPTKMLYTSPSLLMLATCLTNLTFLNFILIIFGEENKLWSFSFCSFLQPSLKSSLKQHEQINIDKG